MPGKSHKVVPAFKRPRVESNSSTDHSPESASSQPQLTKMPISKEMQTEFDKINNSINTLSNNLAGFMSVMTREISDVKQEMELLRKQMLVKTVIITGMPEKTQETFTDTEDMVRTLAAKLGMQNFDFDNVRRMGRPRPNITRPIELTLLRLRDKIELLRLKPMLQKIPEYNRLYINNARTNNEMRIRKQLLDHAKMLKLQQPAAKFRIRNDQLEFTDGGLTNVFKIGPDGKIVEGNSPAENHAMDVTTAGASQPGGAGLHYSFRQ